MAEKSFFQGSYVQLGVLLALALGVGVYLGTRDDVLTDSEIIEAMAARYVEETGGAPTDCFARPAPMDDVRLVVICAPSEGPARAYPVDARGNLMTIEASDLLQEPQS